MQYTHLYAHHDSLLIYFVASVVRVQLSYTLPPQARQLLHTPSGEPLVHLPEGQTVS